MSLPGYYTLRFDPGEAYHAHDLEIDEAGDTVRGRVTIDRGIGPQGRMPGPDDDAHLLAFETAPQADGSLDFEVSCGIFKPVSYRFSLRLDDGGNLTGSVALTPGGTKQVTGTRAEAPQDPGRLG